MLYNVHVQRVLLDIQPGRENVERGLLGIEHVLSAIHPLKLAGLTLVLAAVDGRIRFQLRVPTHAVRLVTSFLYVQCPNARCRNLGEVDEVPNPESSAIRFLRLRRPGPFPVKRHPQLVDSATKTSFDPLGVLMTALIQGDSTTYTTVEIELESLPDKYRQSATNALHQLSAREFPQCETWTDRYLQLCLMSGIRRALLTPIAKLCLKQIPYPEEQPARPMGTESTQTHDRESDLQACLSKIRHHLFHATIRVVVTGLSTDGEREATLDAIVAAFAQFDLPGLNGFVPLAHAQSSVLSTEELATLWHLPSESMEGTHLDPIGNTILPPPRGITTEGDSKDVTVLGTTLYRDEHLPVGLDTHARRRHVWIVGKTGTGKSTLLENMILADIERGSGVGVLDPHGDLATSLLRKIPSSRTNDVVWIDPADESYPISFNPLDVPREKTAFAADGILMTFMKLFASGEFASWGPRLEDIFRNTLLALIETGGSTLLDVLRMLDDDDALRRRIIPRIRDPVVRHWWTTEFPKLKANRREDPFASVTNKLRQLLTVPTIRNILSQRRNRLDLRMAMDSRKIMLCNLAKGKLGERTSMFLGSLLMTRLQLDAMSRADRPENRRMDFYLYVDEFQSFATPSFAEVLSEARKYRLNLTLANQFLGQMPESLTQAILGNVGTIIGFQVGAEDALVLAEELGEKLVPLDLVSLPRYQCYVRTDLEGTVGRPFSIQTLPPTNREPDRLRADRIIRLSRTRYATHRTVVEAAIARAF